MHAYTHTYIHACTHAHTQIPCIHTYTKTHTYIHTYIHMPMVRRQKKKKKKTEAYYPWPIMYSIGSETHAKEERKAGQSTEHRRDLYAYAPFSLPCLEEELANIN